MNDAQEAGSLGSGNWGGIFLTASEDLGNGMKAIAKYGFNVDVDNRTRGNRDAYIGLSGGFGTVLAGRMSTPYKSSTVKWDPFLATSGQARSNFGASGLHNSYANNVVAYANKFGPAKVVLGVSLDESDNKDVTVTNPTGADGEYDAEHTTTASINVPVGPVEVAIGYLNADAVDDGDATKVGVKYTAGAIGVNFQYETLGAGAMTLSGDSLATVLQALPGAPAGIAADGETFMLVNATYSMGANTFAISYGQNSQDYTYVGGDDSIDNTHTTVGVVHSFSKTTSVHAAYTALDVDGEEDASGVALGMRVKF
jgi:predicted porin